MKKRAFAVFAAPNARYACAAIAHNGECWHVSYIRSWTATPLNKLLLLGRGVNLAISTHWRRGIVGNGEVVAGNEGEEVLSARASEAELEHHLSEMRSNITAAIPAEAYLCALPLCIAKQPPAHFLSVRRMKGCVEIGFIADNFLTAVFRLAPADTKAIAGHVGRVLRYIARAQPHLPSPEKAYVIGADEVAIDIGIDSETLPTEPLGAGELDDDSLRAVGVALAEIRPVVGLLHGETTESTTRRFRTSMLIGAAALLVTAIGGMVGSLAYDFTQQRMLQARQKQYQQLLEENNDIRQLSESASGLAVRILDLERTLASQTRWTEFLELLSQMRPKGLRFDQLGSEQTGTDNQLATIGLSGWARSQADVTALIGDLQQVPFLSNISLASLEREKDSNLTGFRIVCTLRLRDS